MAMWRTTVIGVAGLLAACAPAFGPGADDAPGALVRVSPSALRIVNASGEAFAGDPARPGGGPTLVVAGGPDLVPLGEARVWCVPRGARGEWACTLPDVVAGAGLDVAFGGGVVLDATLTFYRASRGPAPLRSTLGGTGR